MPKLKTKSSTKRRFRFTANGKIKFNPARRRHMMRRRTQRMKRQTRGGEILNASDTKIVAKWTPYGKRPSRSKESSGTQKAVREDLQEKSGEA